MSKSCLLKAKIGDVIVWKYGVPRVVIGHSYSGYPIVRSTSTDSVSSVPFTVYSRELNQISKIVKNPIFRECMLSQ